MARRRYRVMLSSTFLDLKDHREIARQALAKHNIDVVIMEERPLSAKFDVIAGSFDMVDQADAYLCMVAQRYGSVIEPDERNPNALSTTELELDQALARGIPLAAIVFSDKYPVPPSQMDLEPKQRKKLEAFRQRLFSNGIVGSVDDLDAFREMIHVAADQLLQSLEEDAAIERISRPQKAESGETELEDIVPPKAPAFYSASPYAQGMSFWGRARELDKIAEWAHSNEPLLVVEAIGGMGKSVLTREWAQNRAESIRPDFAGRFWYSFYEKGANMRDFCIQALAYIEHVAPSTFLQMSRHDLRTRLLKHLSTRPWLLVLDGLERVLVAYQRYDAAQIKDEQGDTKPKGADPDKDPNMCASTEDDELLRDLTGVQGSKLLVSTRNMPTSFLVPGGSGSRSGVLPFPLEGLATDDAEQLLRRNGVRGDGAAMRTYLKTNFDCHPLMVGVIAGLVQQHEPMPGDFDDWQSDPLGGKALDLAKLEGLVSKRNHVLKVAFDGLPEDVRRLLQLLAFFSSAIGYSTLSTLNPIGQNQHAETWLRGAIKTLRRRGLLISDASTASYDLHPLVRGFTRDGLSNKERADTGEVVADYAREQAPEAVGVDSSSEEIERFIELLRVLSLGGNLEELANLISSGVYRAMYHIGRVPALYSIILNLFDIDNKEAVEQVSTYLESKLANEAGLCASSLGLNMESLFFYKIALQSALKYSSGIDNLNIDLSNLLALYRRTGGISKSFRLVRLLRCFDEVSNERNLRNNVIDEFIANVDVGNIDENKMNHIYSSIDKDSKDSYYRTIILYKMFVNRKLDNINIDQIIQYKMEAKSHGGKNYINRILVQSGYSYWRLGLLRQARDDLEEAIMLGREAGVLIGALEANYAKLRAETNDTDFAREEAHRLEQVYDPPHLRLAELWLELGEHEKAREHVRIAYPKAWADGPPYAFHWDLQDCRAVMEAIGEPEPPLESRTPEDVEPLEFEAEILELIEKEKARRAEAKQR